MILMLNGQKTGGIFTRANFCGRTVHEQFAAEWRATYYAWQVQQFPERDDDLSIEYLPRHIPQPESVDPRSVVQVSNDGQWGTVETDCGLVIEFPLSLFGVRCEPRRNGAVRMSRAKR